MARTNKQVTNLQDPPVVDKGRAPYTPPEAKERGNGGGADPNAEPPGKDRVYGVASRARWPGSDSESLHEQHTDSRTVDNGGESEEEEEEEEEEQTSAEDLSVAELKAALDEAKVTYAGNAKKADLVKLYNDNGLGG